jgi:hypothetical protein
MERERRNTVDWLVSENSKCPLECHFLQTEGPSQIKLAALYYVSTEYRDAGTSHACRTRQ